MALQGLTLFLVFQILDFLQGKRFVFVKATPWKDGDELAGSKVVVQIIEDETAYPKKDVSNFGEQLTVKVRGVAPSAFGQLRPLGTEVTITDVERATVYGDYRNFLSIIGKISVKDTPAK